jgi:predicted dithiol-disulfide oxidoreductase (DUF899 family)
MSLPKIVTREEWLAARKELLAKEKDLTRRRDALNIERRNLPMVEIERDYVFDGPNGAVRLIDMFEDRPQLILYHFMFDPEWEDGCPSCTAGTDELSPGFFDFGVTIDESVAPGEYNYRTRAEYEAMGADFFQSDQPFELPGRSCFLQAGGRVFHSYSQYARGLESTGGSYYFLDLTALGRQEEWEEPKGRSESARSATPDFSS